MNAKHLLIIVALAFSTGTIAFFITTVVLLVSLPALSQPPRTWNASQTDDFGITRMELSDSPSPPQILLRVLKPDQFQGVAIWEHSYDMENWLAYHADSLMPTNRALVENKRYSQNRRLLQSHFFRTRFLRRSPQIQTNWLVHIENTSPQNLQNVALTVLSMGNDAPLVVQMGFWVRPNCTFYNWAPPSCNPSYGLTTLEFTAAGWDSMRVERLANLTVSQGASEYFLLRITCRSTLKPTR